MRYTPFNVNNSETGSTLKLLILQINHAPMKSTLLIQLVLFFLVTGFGYSQSKYPDDAFISPLDISLKLSGTFGELRSNHFHSGIDIKTNEQTGLNVYAVADGYVSRIKIQSGGYGKALYITHPNGFVSVYGHLSKYNDEINKWVKQNQYSKQSYEVDLYPEPGKFAVKQGDIVAYSGNSGRSGGPHLHFELRSAADQKPVNPLLFGYPVYDKTAPTINLFKIYPFGIYSEVNGNDEAVDFYPSLTNGKYVFKNDKTVEAAGQVYFGINTVDLFNGGMNRNGVYEIEVLVDSKPFYKHKLETFSFDETRYINSLIDYKEYKTKNRQVQKTFVEPNNKLSIYQGVENSGILKVMSGRNYLVEVRVYDAVGNFSTLEFTIKGTEIKENQKSRLENKKQVFSYKGNNNFKNEWINLEIPGIALYDTLHFNYRVLPKTLNRYSAIHQIGNPYTPLHTWCSLMIRGDSVPKRLQDKAIIAEVTDDGIESAGGTWTNGFVSTKIRNFGKFCIVVDTIAPVITALNIKNQKSVASQKSIKLKIEDELSGISNYKPTLNGAWILMEYDVKNDLLTYYFDEHLLKGKNEFKLEVWDAKNNYSVYEATLNN